jgi:hypothetical protein
MAHIIVGRRHVEVDWHYIFIHGTSNNKVNKRSRNLLTRQSRSKCCRVDHWSTSPRSPRLVLAEPIFLLFKFVKKKLKNDRRLAMGGSTATSLP